MIAAVNPEPDGQAQIPPTPGRSALRTVLVILFGATLAEMPLAQAQLAEMALDVDAAALLVYRAAWTKDVLGTRVTREAAMAKLFATDAAMRVTTDAVQVLGGYGYVADHPVERYMREAKVLQIVEGTNQIQRLVISRSLNP